MKIIYDELFDVPAENLFQQKENSDKFNRETVYQFKSISINDRSIEANDNAYDIANDDIKLMTFLNHQLQKVNSL